MTRAQPDDGACLMASLAGPALVLALVLAACGGSPPRPSASPSPSPTVSKKPKPKPKPSTTPPTPTATTPPPPSGEPMTTAGAFLALEPPSEPVRVANTADCGTVFPDLAGARCGVVPMEAGSLLWGWGTTEGHNALRLLTQDGSGGYVRRYAAAEGRTRWTGVQVFAAPVIGAGPDGVGVVIPLVGGAATYDVLTWVKGGPLVLRAHRGAVPEGRLAPVEGGLAEYLRQPDGVWVKRRVAWDGTRFLLSEGVRVPERAVPAR
jgi:hypothetical protein